MLLSTLLATLPLTTLQDWPQGTGPNGDWSTTGEAPPLEFSVRTGKNVRWRTPLPETGQGGVTVVGDRVFVTTMAPWDPANALPEEEAKLYAHAIEKRSVVGKHIDAHCLDAASGELLWTKRLEGVVPAIYTYPFSDATSASPVADDEHVWFTNAAGRVACFTHAGEREWERTWTPAFDGPFNKQFEPFLVHDGERAVLVHMEPFAPPGRADDDESFEGRWHHLIGLDAASGDVLWRSVDALTQYNAPTLVTTESGPAALIARGGPHAVPERPVGVSLVRLTGDAAGDTIWRYEDARGNHEASLQTMAHDDRFAYWLLKEPRNACVVLDLGTGEEVKEISLVRGVARTYRSETGHGWVKSLCTDLDKGVFPARYSMVAAAGALYFQCYATAWGKPTIGPAYSFARVDPEAGTVAYLEVPTDVVHGDGDEPTRLWRTPRVARPLNSRGVEVTGDDRCRWDGWDWVFNGSPTRVDDRLYFTLASGVVYVFDASAEGFGRDALLAVNDVGVAGETWTANSISYARGRLYHRTSSHLVCIGPANRRPR